MTSNINTYNSYSANEFLVNSFFNIFATKNIYLEFENDFKTPMQRRILVIPYSVLSLVASALNVVKSTILIIYDFSLTIISALGIVLTLGLTNKPFNNAKYYSIKTLENTINVLTSPVLIVQIFCYTIKTLIKP